MMNISDYIFLILRFIQEKVLSTKKNGKNANGLYETLHFCQYFVVSTKINDNLCINDGIFKYLA